MTKKLPWTKLRTTIAILGIISFLVACYGIWLLFAGDRIDNSSDSKDDYMGFLVAFLGVAIAFVSSILTIVFGVIYAIIVRNLRKPKKSTPRAK